VVSRKRPSKSSAAPRTGLAAVQCDLQDLLPSLIENAVASYCRFSAAEVPGDAKGFAAYHGACRVALTHLDMLQRIARGVQAGGSGSGNSGGSGESGRQDQATLIEKARAAMAQMEGGAAAGEAAGEGASEGASEGAGEI